MINVKRYNNSFQIVWNSFISSSKNGTFLFDRNYMDYHSDRFLDRSLMFYDSGNLVAVLPANLNGDSLESHGGLTFGGLITDKKMTIHLMMNIFDELKKYCLEHGIERIIYKSIPHIYHQIFAEEDLYALFLHGARLYRRDVSSTIELSNRLPFKKARRGSLKKALVNGVIVKQSQDFESFMKIDEQHLINKHKKKPVHSFAELLLLKGRFPKNIQLYGAYLDDVMLGGVILYVTETVAHAQYIAATPEGKKLSALDAVLNYLIGEQFNNKRYFDFGISTDREGQFLDLNLVANKESFGARTTVYDFYEWDLKS